MRNKYIIITIIILIGIFLRFHNLRGNTIFEWDQENSIAFTAKNIITDHHFPLIGPRTGVGGLYIGPLYSYLSALFYLIFHFDPISGAIMAGTISVITLIVGFILVKNAFDLPVALYFTVIWSLSTFIVGMDRIPWNVNLLPVSSLLVTFGLWQVLMEKRINGWFCTGLGILIGVNSHFSVVLLLFIVMLFALVNYKKIDRSIIIFIFILLAAGFPFILFEFRHRFILTANLLKFISGSTNEIENIIIRLGEISGIISETIGRMLIDSRTLWIPQLLTIFLIVSLIILRKNIQIINFLKIFIPFIVIYLIGFSLYSGSIPEYYFLGLLPISAIGFSLIFDKFHRNYKVFPIFAFILFTVITYNTFSIISVNNPAGLGAKQNIVSEIKQLSNRNKISVVYDMDLGNSFGYEYLFDYYKVDKTATSPNNTYWISYPIQRFPGKPDYTSGDISLGTPLTVSKIYQTKTVNFYNNLFRARIPKDWSVLQCPSVDFDQYLLTSNSSASCQTIDEKQEGVIIDNLPDCNIWETDYTDLKMKGSLTLYLIPIIELKNKLNRETIIATSFERDRCIVFIDLGNFNTIPLSEGMKYFLENLKK